MPGSRTPAPTPRRMSSDARRRQLLDVALELFAERGYHATSISHIIDRADVARGTFYQYFRSKREIFDSLLDHLFAEVIASVTPIAIAAPEAMAVALRANVQALCQTLQENLPMARVLLEQAVGLDEGGRRQLREFYARVLERLERAVTVGQKLGMVRRGNAGLISVFLLAMVKEPLYQQIIGTRASSAESLVSEIFETIQQGVLLIRLTG